MNRNCDSFLCISSSSFLSYRELNQIIGAMRKAGIDHHKCSSRSNEKIVTADVGLTKLRREDQNGIDIGDRINETWPRPIFDLLNLVPSTKEMGKLEWKIVGNITQDDGPIINTIRLPSTPSTSGGGHESKHRFRVVTGIAPPFVQESTRLDNGSCLMGVPCLRVTLFTFCPFSTPFPPVSLFLIDSRFDSLKTNLPILERKMLKQHL